MDKLRNCTFDKFLKRFSVGVLLLQKHLPKYFLSNNIFLILDLLCKIVRKPSASCFIFSGLHKPKKHQVYYSRIIKPISLSVLGINDKFHNISNSRSGNHDNIVSWN